MEGTTSTAPLSRPTITLSTLARAMGPTSPRTLGRLLVGHKYRKDGPRRSYQAARSQAIELLIHGTPLDPEASLRGYERDVIHAMKRMRLRRPEWVRAVRPGRMLPRWELEGVTVSMQPDVELEGRLASGAAKFTFTKEPLPRGVGSTMAALLFHHRRRVLGIESTRPEQCIVYEPRLPWLHLPSARPDAQLRSAALACRIIAALWPAL